MHSPLASRKKSFRLTFDRTFESNDSELSPISDVLLPIGPAPARVKSSRICGRGAERHFHAVGSIGIRSVGECNRSHDCLSEIELTDQEPCLSLLHKSLAPLAYVRLARPAPYLASLLLYFSFPPCRSTFRLLLQETMCNGAMPMRRLG